MCVCVCVCVCKRERQTDRQTDRQRQRQSLRLCGRGGVGCGWMGVGGGVLFSSDLVEIQLLTNQPVFPSNLLAVLATLTVCG